MGRVVFAAMAALMVAGCTQPVCTPNETQACLCEGQRNGTQTCNAQGTAYSACACADRCEAETCQGHGTCSVDESGATACACFAAYDGARCERCAPGAEDPEGDGTCALRRCDADSCSRHGACSLVGGELQCACAEGYTGPRCASCAEGYELDAAGACVMPTCVREQCNGRGLCNDDASCACFAAYSGAACERCAAGFQDQDGDGVCRPACTATTCGGHGACVDTSGTARCSCDALHAGPDCAACAPGAQDSDGDGTCAPTCVAAGLSCVAPAACSDASGAARCECTAGYVDDGVDFQGRLRCRWAGLIADPELPVGSPHWQLLEDAGVQWLPSTPAQFDPGAVSLPFNAAGLRRFFAWQDLVVPPATVPWAIDMKYASASLAAVRIGAATVVLPTATDGIVSACVGDTFEPGPTRVRLGSFGGLTAGTFAALQNISVDHVTLRPAPECPAPGALPNGDFDLDEGWVLDNAHISTVSGEGALRMPVGGCDASEAARQLSVPSRGTAAPNALRFTRVRAGDTASRLYLRLDTGFLELPFDTNVTNLCVPAGLRGRVVKLSFRGVLSVACGVPRTGEFTIDDLEFFHDPQCAVERGVINPGFRTDAAWTLSGSAALVNDASTNSRVLRINTPTVCGGGRASQTALVPMASSGAGPALRFRYTAQGPTSVPAVIFGADLLQLPKTTGWESKLVCIPPQRAGLELPLEFNANAYGGCGPVLSGETAAFDDVEMVTDPSCPAE